MAVYFTHRTSGLCLDVGLVKNRKLAVKPKPAPGLKPSFARRRFESAELRGRTVYERPDQIRPAGSPRCRPAPGPAAHGVAAGQASPGGQLSQQSGAALPLLSVVVVATNAESYLIACLHSLRSQTLKRIEVLVVDNGSTDGHRRRCARDSGQDPRFRVIRRPRSD